MTERAPARWAPTGSGGASPQRQFVAITGPSGCGKSTLLHLAGGMEQPSGGRVRVGGEDLAELSLAALARVRRQRVGYVFQRLNLVPSLTALENVMLPLELDGIRPKEARDTAGRALELVELPEPLVALGVSPGRYRRLAAAKAAALVCTALLLAVPAAIIPAVVWALNDPAKPVVIPWLSLTVLVAALPAVVALVGWVSARPRRALAIVSISADP